MEKIDELENAARLLAKAIIGSTENVVGVGIELVSEDPPTPGLFVYVDNDKALKHIPRRFHGHKIYILMTETPTLSSAS
jgi:hypothetical protein